METRGHPYANILHRVEKPARYLGGEYNSIVKDWRSVETTFALCFPDVYDIGMSHLGTKILYKVVNEAPDLLMERCFCPWFDMEAALRETQLPLVSLENQAPLSAFDVVGFSLQYEMTYTNILTMLDLGGIPLHASERSLADPLVIAGGPVATQPEAIAPFIDAFLVGDAEERLPRLLRHYAELKNQGCSRNEILVQLASEGGLYCPALYSRSVCERSGLMTVEPPADARVPRRVERAFLDDISRYQFPDDSPVAVARAIFDRLSVEIARGCTEGCRFCQAGMIYRPVRERDPDQVVDTVLGALEKGGYDEASITSLSTADYSCISPLIKKLMRKLRPQKVSLGISSLRAYGLDEDLLDEIASVKATGLTFAPEAGTQRMRNVISKNISEDDIYTTCHRTFSRGWQRIKLYFMIGLPTEDDEDVVGIAEMGRQAVEIGRQYHKNVQVTVSVSTHVPKPHTPFQWCSQDPLREIDRKQGILQELARKWGFKFRWHDMRVSHIEGILSRGDWRTSSLIEHAWRKGARFDGWDEHLAWDLWLEAIAEWEHTHNLSREMFLGTLPVDGRMPWDHIDVGLADGFLAKEYKKALKGRASPPCGKPYRDKVHHTNLQDAEADHRKLVCYHCGIECDLTQMRAERLSFLQKLGAHQPPPPSAGPSRTQRAMARHRKGLAPQDFHQGDAIRYRLRFTKLGPVSLQSGLDVARILPRVGRRAGLAFHYSEGFRPRPMLSLGPALALGAQSLCEFADIGLTQAIEPRALLERLNDHAPDGLYVTAARRLADDEPSVSRRIKVTDFVVALPAAWLAEQLGLDTATWEASYAAVAARLEAARTNRSLDATVVRKNKRRVIPVWNGIERLELVEPAAAASGAEVEAASVGLALRKRNNDNRATLRPAEVVEAVLGVAPPPHLMVVTGYWACDAHGALVDPLAQFNGNALPLAECSIDAARERVVAAKRRRLADHTPAREHPGHTALPIVSEPKSTAASKPVAEL